MTEIRAPSPHPSSLRGERKSERRLDHLILGNWNLFGPALAGLGFGYWDLIYFGSAFFSALFSSLLSLELFSGPSFSVLVPSLRLLEG